MRTTRHAFLLMEMVVGLTLLGVLILGLATVVHQYARATHSFEAQRRGVRAAEYVLSQLHAGKRVSLDLPDMQVELHAVKTPPTPPPGGFAWAVVTVEYRQTEASLVGLVRRKAFDETLGWEKEGTR